MQTVILKLSGLHCTSCAVNIDLTLEDLPGVKSSDTSYAKSEAKITFDSAKTTISQIKSSITHLGYETI
jgi:Cu+-exporting ATPase